MSPVDLRDKFNDAVHGHALERLVQCSRVARNRLHRRREELLLEFRAQSGDERQQPLQIPSRDGFAGTAAQIGTNDRVVGGLPGDLAAGLVHKHRERSRLDILDYRLHAVRGEVPGEQRLDVALEQVFVGVVFLRTVFSEAEGAVVERFDQDVPQLVFREDLRQSRG